VSVGGFTMQGRARHAIGLVVGGLVWLAGCLGGREVVERPSPTIPGSKFKVIATIASGSGRANLRMSAGVRKSLNEGGWQGVTRSGRWDTAKEAVTAICQEEDERHVDGVLFVSYNRLELDDCATGKPAYSIDGSPERGVGIDEMVKRLMRYLRGQQPTSPPS